MEPIISLGLDGTIVAETRLGQIDGNAGQLSYCGYRVQDLAQYALWEEVVYLLWYGELPTAAQLAALRSELAAARHLDADEQALVAHLPTTGHALDALRAMVNLLTALHQPGIMQANTLYATGLRLTAKLPLLLAAWNQRRHGRELVQPPPDATHAEAILTAFHGAPPDPTAAAAFNTYMVLLAEHGLNISTFVARVVASAQNDLYATVDAALAALKGAAHGGANELAMRTFLTIATPADAGAAVEGLLQRKERLMGVGHRIYRTEDPRVALLREHSAALAARHTPPLAHHAIAEAVAAYILAHPHFQARTLYPNVEFYSAPLLYQLGLPLDCFTAAFAFARLPGWIAHIGEQLQVRRLVRPEAAYIGPAPRSFVPLERR